MATGSTRLFFCLAQQQARELLNKLTVVIWIPQKLTYLITLVRKDGSWYLLQLNLGKIMLLIFVDRNSKHNVTARSTTAARANELHTRLRNCYKLQD